MLGFARHVTGAFALCEFREGGAVLVGADGKAYCVRGLKESLRALFARSQPAASPPFFVHVSLVPWDGTILYSGQLMGGRPTPELARAARNFAGGGGELFTSL